MVDGGPTVVYLRGPFSIIMLKFIETLHTFANLVDGRASYGITLSKYFSS